MANTQVITALYIYINQTPEYKHPKLNKDIDKQKS